MSDTCVQAVGSGRRHQHAELPHSLQINNANESAHAAASDRFLHLVDSTARVCAHPKCLHCGFVVVCVSSKYTLFVWACEALFGMFRADRASLPARRLRACGCAGKNGCHLFFQGLKLWEKSVRSVA
jgi:hypothetical protein